MAVTFNEAILLYLLFGFVSFWATCMVVYRHDHPILSFVMTILWPVALVMSVCERYREAWARFRRRR